MVLLAEHHTPFACTDPDIACGLDHLARPSQRIRSVSVRWSNRAVLALLRGHRNQPLSTHRATKRDTPRCNLIPQHPGIPSGRNAFPPSNYRHVYGLVILGLQGKSEG